MYWGLLISIMYFNRILMGNQLNSKCSYVTREIMSHQFAALWPVIVSDTSTKILWWCNKNMSYQTIELYVCVSHKMNKGNPSIMILIMTIGCHIFYPIKKVLVLVLSFEIYFTRKFLSREQKLKINSSTVSLGCELWIRNQSNLHEEIKTL